MLRNLSYEKRIKEVIFFSLSKRKRQGDVIEVFKLCKGFSDNNEEDYN